MPDIRILSVAELDELSAKVGFANAAHVMVATADVKPIDSVVGALAARWGSSSFHAALPTLSYSGALTHAPVPENLRKYTPQKTWNGYDEPVERLVQGVGVDGFAILFMQSPGDPFWKIYGVPNDSPRLVSRRQIPMEAALAVTENAVGAAWAAQEKAAISKGVLPGLPAGSPPRI